jgi:cytochrome c oxidase cbb3-type subunit 3
VPSNRHELGRAIYNFRCYFCHGYSGDAKTLAASYLDPAPRNFKATSPDELSRERMIASVTHGRPSTAMKGFENVISANDIALVVDFVRKEFMERKAHNTAYHTPENGWPNHKQYAPAFPFALGEIPIDTPWDDLTEEQQVGWRIFMQSCVTCHDRAKVEDEGAIWDPRAVSYPREHYSHREAERETVVDAESSATPYASHDIKPVLSDMSAQESRGENLFQKNCAFCHAADGTGKNWIGSFLEPHPRNLTDETFMSQMTGERLHTVIREGLPNTTMSAWKTVLSETQINDIISYINKAFYPLIEKEALDKAASP